MKKFGDEDTSLFKKAECFPYLNCPNVVSMKSMFEGCTLLDDVFLWNTFNVKYADKLCKNCRNLDEAPSLLGKIETASEAFAGCSTMNWFYAWDLSRATDISKMFYGCAEMETCRELIASDWKNKADWNFAKNSSVKLDNIFGGCKKLRLCDRKHMSKIGDNVYVGHDGLPKSFAVTDAQKQKLGIELKSVDSDYEDDPLFNGEYGYDPADDDFKGNPDDYDDSNYSHNQGESLEIENIYKNFKKLF